MRVSHTEGKLHINQRSCSLYGGSRIHKNSSYHDMGCWFTPVVDRVFGSPQGRLVARPASFFPCICQGHSNSATHLTPTAPHGPHGHYSRNLGGSCSRRNASADGQYSAGSALSGGGRSRGVELEQVTVHQIPFLQRRWGHNGCILRMWTSSPLHTCAAVWCLWLSEGFLGFSGSPVDQVHLVPIACHRRCCRRRQVTIRRVLCDAFFSELITAPPNIPFDHRVSQVLFLSTCAQIASDTPNYTWSEEPQVWHTTDPPTGTSSPEYFFLDFSITRNFVNNTT